MPFCQNCGNEIKEGAKFCVNCGSELDQPAGAAAASETPAPEAKPEQPPAPTTQPVQVAPPPAAQPVHAAQPQAQPKGKLPVGAIVGIIIGAIAVVAIAAVVVLNVASTGDELQPNAPMIEINTEKTGSLVEFVQGKWYGEADGKQVTLEIDEETAVLTIGDTECAKGEYSLVGDRFVIYPKESGAYKPLYATLDETGDNSMTLADATGTIDLEREVKLTIEEELAQKIVGYWEGYDTEGSGAVVKQDFAADGQWSIEYGSRPNTDSGTYFFEGDIVKISTPLVAPEFYTYHVSFLNDDNTMVQTSATTGDTIILNRTTKPAATPAPEPAPAPAPAPSPYQQIAGTWSGTLQDGFPIQLRFGADQSFAIAEDGDWFDSGSYSISGDTLSLNGAFTDDTYSYSLDGNSLTLSIPGAGAWFYFTRVG